jgi:putative ATP-dependent endonuclease of OLD family
MYLKRITINNFRKVNYLEANFKPGVNIIVGENNVGKTALVDAIRLIIIHGYEANSLRITNDDFTVFFNPKKSIEISCVFAGLTIEEEAQLYEALAKTEQGFEVHLHLKMDFPENGRSSRPKFLCGSTEGNMPVYLYDYLCCIYLPPLRDPTQGLAPGGKSQISRLIRHLSDEVGKEMFESIARASNEGMLGLTPILQANESINAQINSITGEKLKQVTELQFLDPNFDRLISSLKIAIDELPFYLNGLGYNNLVYIATAISTLQKDKELAYRGILIEEPEAHLHPQLQSLLLRYLEKSAEKEIPSVQVIMTSHSPGFACQANIDSIISLHTNYNKDLYAVSVGALYSDISLKKKLKRYLDATRSELFFAKKIIMVEGISEALLIPVFAVIMGIDLREEAITIINVEGLNFDTFIPLFKVGGIEIPVAIITDGDRVETAGDTNEVAYSLSKNTLKLLQQETISLKVFNNEKTFEHELAHYSENLIFLVKAIEGLYPVLAKQINSEIQSIPNIEAKADYFFNELFVKRKGAKSQLAQELAFLIEEDNYKNFIVPTYIENALKYLINNK